MKRLAGVVVIFALVHLATLFFSLSNNEDATVVDDHAAKRGTLTSSNIQNGLFVNWPQLSMNGLSLFGDDTSFDEDNENEDIPPNILEHASGASAIASTMENDDDGDNSWASSTIEDNNDKDTIYPTARTRRYGGATYVVDMRYHRLRDPHYHLLDSDYFSDEDILSIIQKVVDIWYDAGIFLRFRRSESLAFDDIDIDRAKAYFFYTFGHPIIGPNKRKTQIIHKPDREWIHKEGGPYHDYVKRVLPHHMELRKSSQAMSILKSNPDLFFSSADRDGNSLVDENEFCSWIKSKSKSLSLSAGFDCHAALESLQGYPTNHSISQQSLLIILQEQFPAKTSTVEFRLAYRRFYLDFGISVEDVARFAESMKSRPMLFLHYSIGRDSYANQLLRSAWDFQNMLHLYPVPYYHDMNGRGSTNWMDVVARTSSCWFKEGESNPRRYVHLQRGGTDMRIPVRCRWGVRWWEMHKQTHEEFSRMLAHEIGHTLGLQHPDPKCKVYPTLSDGELMQQQRVFGLQEWFDKKYCKCSNPSKCGNCNCDFNHHPEMYASIAASTKLSKEEVAIARESAASRDYRETRELNSRFVQTIGSSVEAAPILDPLEGPLLSGEPSAESGVSGREILVFANDPFISANSTKAKVTRIRWKASFVYPRRDETSAKPLILSVRWHVLSRPAPGSNQIEPTNQYFDVGIDATRYALHYEHEVSNLTLKGGDMLGMSFNRLQKGQRLRIAVVEDGNANSNSLFTVHAEESKNKKKSRVVEINIAKNARILFNYDVVATAADH